MSKHNDPPRNTRRKTIAILLVVVVVMSGTTLWFATDGLTYNPFGGDATVTTTTNATVTIQQGVKVTGTATYANTTPITGQTLYGVNSDNEIVYIATITTGAFTSQRGPAAGGLHDFYIAISDCILYVATYDIPSADSYDQESVNIGTIEVYTSSTGYTVQLIGATSNTYTSGGSAGTTNFTQSDNVEETYTLRITNTQDYSQLYREYTDPRDDIIVAPVLWIEITTTNAYATTSGVETWADSTKTYFLIPISAIVCEGTLNIAMTWNYGIVLPTTGTFAFSAYIVDGSNIARLYQARARVADPNTGETVTATQIVSAYVLVT